MHGDQHCITNHGEVLLCFVHISGPLSTLLRKYEYPSGLKKKNNRIPSSLKKKGGGQFLFHSFFNRYYRYGSYLEFFKCSFRKINIRCFDTQQTQA